MRVQRHFSTILISAAVLAILLAIPTWASAQISALFSSDLTLHETTTGSGMMGKGGGTQTVTNYFSRSAMKRESSDGNDMIILFDKGTIISIDNKKKTYTETTMQELQAIFDKVGAEMDKNKEAMEAMKKMMGQAAGSFTVTKVGPGGNIAGYATEHYLIAGPMEMEIWAAPELKMPELYYDALKMRIPRNPMFDMGKMYDEMKKINGMALKSNTTIKMMGQEMKTSTVVTAVEKGSIPASKFEVPAGYKSVPNKMLQ